MLPDNLKKLIPFLWSLFYGNHERKVSATGITIAFVGRSGSGISKLIHNATDSHGTNVAPYGWHKKHPKETYTTRIQDQGYTVHGIEYLDFPLVLIDTPGFGPDENAIHIALRALREWLQYFKPETKLDGIVFMHDVSMGELPGRTPYQPQDNILKKLCGEEWAQKVVFLSSHWNNVGAEKKTYGAAQVEKYWSHMLKAGACDPQPYNCRSSGLATWDILRPLVGRALDARKLRLKAELNSLPAELVSNDVCNRIDEVIDQKMEFIQKLALKLGQCGMILTKVECEIYNKLNEEARTLWKEIETALDVLELERLFTAGADKEQVNDTRKITIAVVGSVRSGKSRFIYETTGDREDKIGPEGWVHPHTKEIAAGDCVIPASDYGSQSNYAVTLIDTPGFDYDDETRNEKKVLERLLEWWKTQSENETHSSRPRQKVKLHGMIYLHDIHHNDLENQNSFSHYGHYLEELLGEQWRRQIVFVSSFWSETYQDSQNGRMTLKEMETRERDIKENYWSLMAGPMKRYTQDAKSARKILREILSVV